MKNKVELKKAILCSLIAIVIFGLLFGAINFYEYRKYTKNFNDDINNIIVNVIQKYPDVDKNELIEILNSEKENKVDVLYNYGIDIDKSSAILSNDTLFYNFTFLNLFVLLSSLLSILFIMLKYNHNKDKKLKEITRYIEEINNRNYKLDIDDNTEDELSILKNEIYKTTVMLKEQAENSLNDKIAIKDSLSDISHQLKTPLTSITILLDNIIDNPNMDNETKTMFVKDIRREIININFLVQSLLKLSKFDANVIDYSRKENNIIDIIKEAVSRVATLADLKNVKVKINGNSTDTIFCDFTWQVEAITNIVKNSIEYSNSNDVVEIYFENNKVYSQIIIKDNGKGIDSQDIKHIFDRFYKGKNSSSDSVGIGLALAKTIIEKDNGTVTVDSVLGKGTIFTIKYCTHNI